MICTYYTLDEQLCYHQQCSNREIIKLIDELNKFDSCKWFVREFINVKKNFFKKDRITYFYSLYHQLTPNDMEVQNLNIPSEHITTYLFGVLTGIGLQKTLTK